MKDIFRIKLKGSLTLESAILLPIVVLLFALFLSGFKTIIGFMKVRRALLETADELCGYSYLYEAFGVDVFSVAAGQGEEVEDRLKGAAYQLALNSVMTVLAGQMVKDKLSIEDLSVYGIEEGADGLSFWGTKAFYANGTHKAVITIKVSYRPVLLDGGDFFPLQKVTLQATTHAFLGDNPFEEMSQKDVEVYQIGEGEKYHSLNCYLIDKTITELALWEATKAGYTACSYCKPWEDSKVYVSSGGVKYHTDSCPHLYPNLTSMTLEEAKEKGLEPCELCQSDEEYFTH